MACMVTCLNGLCTMYKVENRVGKLREFIMLDTLQAADMGWGLRCGLLHHDIPRHNWMTQSVFFPSTHIFVTSWGCYFVSI
jgi:hypothetical protein